MKSLNSNKYQSGAGLMTFANPDSGRCDAVKVHDMLEQQGIHSLLRKEFAPAIVNGCHRRSCTEKLAESGEPGTKWASKPIRMTLIKTSASQLLTNHELLKLGRSADAMT